MKIIHYSTTTLRGILRIASSCQPDESHYSEIWSPSQRNLTKNYTQKMRLQRRPLCIFAYRFCLPTEILIWLTMTCRNPMKIGTYSICVVDKPHSIDRNDVRNNTFPVKGKHIWQTYSCQCHNFSNAKHFKVALIPVRASVLKLDRIPAVKR